MQFDPYYTWLGIPPEESAGGGPNCYRLLGLVLYESNLDVIENAADRQMMHLRSFQTGIHGADSQRLLNEIASARIRLLDATQKAAYDAELRQSLAPRLVQPRPATTAAAKPVAPITRSAAPGRTRPSSAGTAITLGMIIVGGVAGLGLGSLVVSYMSSRGMIAFSAKPQQNQPPPAPEPRPSSPGVPWNDWKIAPLAPPAPDEPAPATEPSDFSTRIPPPDDRPPVASSPLPEFPSPPAPKEEAPRPTYLFAAIPRSFRLPPLISSEPASLLKLAREPEEPLSVKIDSSAANIPAGSAITADADPQGRGWTLSFVTDAAAAAGRVMLAIIRREGLDLSLAWAVPLNDSELRRQLANCLLEVGTVKDSRVIQLREPERLGPLVLDLEKESQIVEIYLPDAPPLGKVALKIVELSGFDRGGKLRGGASTFTLGKSVFIDFTEMKGAQVELRFPRPSAAGKFSLRVDPVFKEPGGKEFELTLPRLEKFQQGHENSLSTANTRIPILKRNLVDAQSILRNLQSMQPANIQEDAMRRPKLVAAASTVQSIDQQIARLQRQAEESKARLNAVPEVRSFIQSLNKQATIRYIISADCGDKELVLVDGQSGAASGQR